MIQCPGPIMSDDWYRPTITVSPPKKRAAEAMIQLPPLAAAWATPIVQSAATARKPNNMCNVIKFNAVPVQNNTPEMSASNPAKLRAADAIRTTIDVRCELMS